MALDLVVATATALVLVNTVVIVRDLFGGSNADVAIALAFFGAGSMAVALVAPRALERVRDRTFMLVGGALLVAGLPAVAVLASAGPDPAGPGVRWAVLLGLWLALGTGTSMIGTPSSRLVRGAATDETRTYLFTAQFSLSHACFLLAYPLAGWVGAAANQSVASLVLGAVALAAMIAAVLVWPPDGRRADGGPPGTGGDGIAGIGATGGGAGSGR
jgi:predicted MFS family arabinose efflux permease